MRNLGETVEYSVYRCCKSFRSGLLALAGTLHCDIEDVIC
jgi:hypothetical protein